jgi:hypothetical protein
MQLYCEPSRPRFEPPRLQDGPPWLDCEHLQFPAFHFDADLDPASQNDAVPGSVLQTLTYST